MAAAEFGLEGFMVSNFGFQVLTQAFRASGSLFSVYGLKTHTQKHKK